MLLSSVIPEKGQLKTLTVASLTLATSYFMSTCVPHHPSVISFVGLLCHALLHPQMSHTLIKCQTAADADISIQAAAMMETQTHPNRTTLE